MTKARTRTAIIGLGITGMSCVRFLAATDDLVVLDTREAPPGLAELLAEFPDVTVHTGVREFDYANLDRVVVSPGVGLDDPVLAGLPDGVPMVSDIDLFCEAASAPILAVTGTNGKSTVTSMAGHLLRESGLAAVVGGNLGEAALDLLADGVEVFVLELSSFQLERMAPQPFRAATVLNVSEDHLDRHGDMAAYVAAKQRIYEMAAVCVANRDDPATFPNPDKPVVTFGGDTPEDGHWGIVEGSDGRWLAKGDVTVLPSRSLPIAGRHNELNTLAAMALADVFGLSIEQMASAATTFEGLPHRCQRVGVRGGVEFINDSKATNVGATSAALLGLGDPETPRIVLIAGGDGKGADFSVLKDLVGRFVRVVILLGRDAPLLEAALRGSAELHRVDDMAGAVARAVEVAQRGDLVLLSPACASLDMYVNFAARGADFTRAVEALAA